MGGSAYGWRMARLAAGCALGLVLSRARAESTPAPALPLSTLLAVLTRLGAKVRTPHLHPLFHSAH